ncbi:MAG: DUF1588 domain-containing protein [Polyangiaceae bacterium]|nr:DUF1588 domain-containing protein [Polyangiaceae bacterium]
MTVRKVLSSQEEAWLRRPGVRRWHSPKFVLVLAAALSGACGAEVPRGTAAKGGSPGPGGPTGPAGPTAQPMVNAAWPVDFNGQASSLRRLSRDELLTTMKGLTGQAPARADLPAEMRSGHHLLRTTGLSFIATEVGKLYPVVKAFAGKTAPALLTQSGCKQSGQAQRDCLASWAQSFATRVLRRAPRADEAAKYKAIVADADGTAGMDTGAVEGVLTALFFAPSFLYRTEVGAPLAGTPTRRVLLPNELAAKLSFFASLGPPDAPLLTAANNGSLNDGAERVRQFERLSQTVDGKRALSVFIHEWLGANESKLSQKSTAYLTGVSATFPADMRADADGFIDVVLASADPTVGNLLTGKGYVTDPVLKQVTDQSQSTGVATGDVSAYERIGLLMHPQVISSHTKENGSSPFQLGAFLREALLCEKVAPPPAGATNMTKQGEPAGLSMRQSLEFKTSAPVCSSCHAQFAPLGFSFMAFDPVGRWVSKDPTGKPWDLSGTTSTSNGTMISFQSPAELVRALATSPQVQGCFAQAALEWSLGRGLTASDVPLVTALDAQVRKNGGNVPAILKAIVSAPEFINVGTVSP